MAKDVSLLKEKSKFVFEGSLKLVNKVKINNVKALINKKTLN